MRKSLTLAATRFVVAELVVAIVLVWHAPAASAKGEGLLPVRDRYEPGEVASLVGYTRGPLPTTAFEAAIAKDMTGPAVQIGRLSMQATGNPDPSLAVRVSITFPLPHDLPPGTYSVGMRDESRTAFGINDLLWGVMFIGVDPPAPPSRRWAIEEPEVANLAPDAVIHGTEFTMTAREVWQRHREEAAARLAPTRVSGDIGADPGPEPAALSSNFGGQQQQASAAASWFRAVAVALTALGALALLGWSIGRRFRRPSAF